MLKHTNDKTHCRKSWSLLHLQQLFPAFGLCRQHRFPRGCAAVSQLINAALPLFFPQILFSSKVNDAFPVVCSCPASPSPAAAAGSTQAQLCPNSLVTSARTAQAPAVPQCRPKFLTGCQDQEDPGIWTTETSQGGAQNPTWSFSKLSKDAVPKRREAQGDARTSQSLLCSQQLLVLSWLGVFRDE